MDAPYPLLSNQVNMLYGCPFEIKLTYFIDAPYPLPSNQAVVFVNYIPSGFGSNVPRNRGTKLNKYPPTHQLRAEKQFLQAPNQSQQSASIINNTSTTNLAQPRVTYAFPNQDLTL